MSPIRFIAIPVIDLSSSMLGVSQALHGSLNKYFKFLISLGDPEAVRVSLVAFAGVVQVIFEFKKLEDIDITGQFQHSRGTALYAGALKGIELGKEHVARCVEQPEIPKVSVTVFTDGWDSRSATSLPALRRMVESVKPFDFELRLVGIGIDVGYAAREMGFDVDKIIHVEAHHPRVSRRALKACEICPHRSSATSPTSRCFFRRR